VAAVRDGPRALALAETIKGSGINPKTLSWIVGIARYRTGDWQGCVTALAQCLPEDGPGPVDVAYYLAMSCHQAGRPDEAARYLRLARKWSRAPESWYELRGLLRAEAEALLTGTGTRGR